MSLVRFLLSYSVPFPLFVMNAACGPLLIFFLLWGRYLLRDFSILLPWLCLIKKLFCLAQHCRLLNTNVTHSRWLECCSMELISWSDWLILSPISSMRCHLRCSVTYKWRYPMERWLRWSELVMKHSGTLCCNMRVLNVLLVATTHTQK